MVVSTCQQRFFSNKIHINLCFTKTTNVYFFFFLNFYFQILARAGVCTEKKILIIKIINFIKAKNKRAWAKLKLPTNFNIVILYFFYN